MRVLPKGINHPASAYRAYMSKEATHVRLAVEQAVPDGYALAVHLLGNPDDAADALQDAVLRVFGTASYRPSDGTFKPWFLAIVRNRCMDLLRQRRRHPEVDLDAAELASDAGNPETALERDEQASLVATELAALPAAQREILILREYLDLSYAEIADVLSIPPGTVMSRLHRARSALADRFRQRGTR